MSIKASEKNIEMLFSISPSTPLALVGDPMRLGQVLTNLLDNAVKFTNEGEIVLSIDPVYIDKETEKLNLLFEILELA